MDLSIKWDQSACTIAINQSTYIESIAKHFSINKKAIYIPMHTGTILSSSQSPLTPEEKELKNNIPYHSLLGALQYSATVSSPEIVFPLSICAQYTENPSPAHWKALCQIAQYL